MDALRALTKMYFVIGAVLANILYASYLWPISYWGQLSDASLMARVIYGIKTQPRAVFWGVVRLVGWGPELAYWATSADDDPIGKWAAPGVYLKFRRRAKP